MSWWARQDSNLEPRDYESSDGRLRRKDKAALYAAWLKCLEAHSAVYNLFNLGRHLVSAKHYRRFRQRAFASWECATGP